MFGTTLFECCVRKDTFQNMINKFFKQTLTYQLENGLSISALLGETHRYTWLSNWFMGRGLNKMTDRRTELHCVDFNID